MWVAPETEGTQAVSASVTLWEGHLCLHSLVCPGKSHIFLQNCFLVSLCGVDAKGSQRQGLTWRPEKAAQSKGSVHLMWPSWPGAPAGGWGRSAHCPPPLS